jgi:colanic acid/amylovoran biosynthesis protein
MLLLHTSGQPDRDLAQLLSEEEGVRGVECVVRDDPYEIKEIISGAHAVVGSRFHGLASALSQGVPSVALGWSHKYAALFSDFGIRDYAFDSSVTPAGVAASVARILEVGENSAVRARLAERLSQLSEVNERMWSMVCTVLRCRA